MTRVPDDELDAPLDPDEALLQRYLDGTLSPAEADAAELRMERDPAFAARFDAYASLFAALDLASQPPPTFAPAAEAIASLAPARSVASAFGDLARTLGAFVLLDLVLGAALAAYLVVRGPVEVLKAWLLTAKDLVVLMHDAAPTPEQAAAFGAVAVLAAAVLLGATVVGIQRVLTTGGTQR